MKAVFLDYVFENRAAIHLPDCEFEILPPLKSAQELIEAAKEAEIILMRDQFIKLSAEVITACPHLKLVATRSSGYDHIDLAAAKAGGVAVCNVPDYGAHMIAEQAFGLMLAVARNICRGNERYREMKHFDDTGLAGVELFGKTLGVIGAGRIGRHSIRIAKGFGMQVVAYDVVENASMATEMGFSYIPLQSLMEKSDFISVHIPLLESTHHLINRETLAYAKPGAILVNTSRGPVVDTAALKEALLAGRLRGAGLDVLEDERTVYHDFGPCNVVITPHLGWNTEEARARILQISLDNVAAWIAGKPINQVV
jgi:D-lactate dehydrogenase